MKRKTKPSISAKRIKKGKQEMAMLKANTQEREVEFDIIQSHGHYVVLKNGKFYCSADTYLEAAREIAD